MLRFLLLRLPVVALAAALAGAAAYVVLSGREPVYERTVTFVLRPSANLTDAQIPDAVRGLSQQDAQLVNTIGSALGSRRFLAEALRRAQIPGGDAYSARSSVRPGSDIVEIRLRGPDPDALTRLGDEHTDVAAAWVGTVYRAYTLELLQAEGGETPVAPRTGQTTVLAALLGAFLAAGAVFAEWKARRRWDGATPPSASRRPTPRRDPPDPGRSEHVRIVRGGPPAAASERRPERTQP
jgi:capsular polysaccharide biosynthesis protein